MKNNIRAYFNAFFLQFDKGNNNAAALAYYTLFSIFPLFYLTFSLAEKLFGVEKMNEITVSLLEQVFGSIDSVDFIDFVKATPYFHSNFFLDCFSVCILLFSSSSIIISLQNSMNEIFGVHKNQRSKKKKIKESFIVRFYSLGTLAIIALVIIMFASIQIILITFFEKVLNGENLITAISIFLISMIITFLSNASIIYLIYKKTSDVYIEKKHLKVPVILTALLMTIGQYLLKFYLNEYYVFADAGLTGSILILLLWVYICSTFIFGGAFYLSQIRCSNED